MKYLRRLGSIVSKTAKDIIIKLETLYPDIQIGSALNSNEEDYTIVINVPLNNLFTYTSINLDWPQLYEIIEEFTIPADLEYEIATFVGIGGKKAVIDINIFEDK